MRLTLEATRGIKRLSEVVGVYLSFLVFKTMQPFAATNYPDNYGLRSGIERNTTGTNPRGAGETYDCGEFKSILLWRSCR